MIKLSGGAIKIYKSPRFNVASGGGAKLYSFAHNLGEIPNYIKVFYDYPSNSTQINVELPKVATWWVNPTYGWFEANDVADYLTTTQIKIYIWYMSGTDTAGRLECAYLG